MSRFSLGFSKLTSLKNGEKPSSPGTEPSDFPHVIFPYDFSFPMIEIMEKQHH